MWQQFWPQPNVLAADHTTKKFSSFQLNLPFGSSSHSKQFLRYIQLKKGSLKQENRHIFTNFGRIETKPARICLSVQALQLCNRHFALNRDVSKDIEAHLFWGLGKHPTAKESYLYQFWSDWDKTCADLFVCSSSTTFQLIFCSESRRIESY